MRLFEELVSRTGIVGELFKFFWNTKWWWLTPMLLRAIDFWRSDCVCAKLGYCTLHLYALLVSFEHFNAAFR